MHTSRLLPHYAKRPTSYAIRTLGLALVVVHSHSNWEREWSGDVTLDRSGIALNLVLARILQMESSNTLRSSQQPIDN